jgi:hypothetical protein
MLDAREICFTDWADRTRTPLPGLLVGRGRSAAWGRGSADRLPSLGDTTGFALGQEAILKRVGRLRRRLTMRGVPCGASSTTMLRPRRGELATRRPGRGTAGSSLNPGLPLIVRGELVN